jgi:hypothetical protein
MAGDKNINIGVGADVSGLKTGMNDAAKLVQDAGTKMQTAAKDATQKTEQSFSNLRQAYRATARDAYEIALSQGTNSAAFLEATEKAGRFKDELDLVNNKIKAFSSDTPVLTSALGVGQGLAGGFAAAQGAMALFGNSSKEVEQALLKVQGAMALLQGLQAIGQLGDAMSTFATTINVKVLPALMTMKGAMIATGIGAFAIAVGFLAGKFIEIKEKNDAATAAEKRYKDEVALAKKAVDDKVGSLNLEIIAIKNKTSLAGASLIQAKAEKAALEEQIAAIEKHNAGLEKNTDTRLNNGMSLELSTDALKKNLETKKQEIVGLELIAKKTKELEDAQKSQADAEAKVLAGKKTKDKLKDIVETPEVKRPDSNFNKIETAVDLTKWGENLEAAKIPLTSFVNTARTEYQNFLDETAKFNEAVRTTLESGVENAFIDMSASIGNSLATGANVMEGIGAVLLEAVGSMAIQLGQLAIQTGITMKTIKMSFKNPYTAIAAGIALVALGSYVSSKAKSITNGGGGGGNNAPSPDNSPSNRNVFSGFTPANNSMVLTTRLIGQDLLMSVQKAGQQNTRVR